MVISFVAGLGATEKMMLLLIVSTPVTVRLFLTLDLDL